MAFDDSCEVLAHARDLAAPDFQADPVGGGVDLIQIDIDPPVFPASAPDILAEIPDPVDRGSVRIREYHNNLDPIAQ